MATGTTVSEPSAVVAALHHPDLWPPPPPLSLGPGPTAGLRRRMARFSPPADHPPRRQRVDGVVDQLDQGLVAGVAAARTVHHLGRRPVGSGPVEVGALTARVVVEAVAAGLGLLDPAGDGATTDRLAAALVADVDAVVAAIGRQAPADPVSDAATVRLLAAAGAGDGRGAVPGVDVAVVSLLYQSMDATAALAVQAAATRIDGGPLAPPVPSTVRVAATALSLGDAPVRVEPGAMVRIVLGPGGTSFGSGPHRCPGRHLAEAVVAAVLGTLDRRDRRAGPDDVERDDDGRARAVWFR